MNTALLTSQPRLLGKLSIRLACALSFLCLFWVSESFAADNTSDTREGEYSVVRLLDVIRTQPRHIPGQKKNAEDGLTFLFFIGRRPSLEGLFNLTELRDFQVQGQSYRERSTRALGQPIEPHTVLDEVSRFAQQFPHVADKIPAGFATAVSMVTTIGGAALVEGKPAEVSIDVGWGDKHEVFSFSFSVPRKQP